MNTAWLRHATRTGALAWPGLVVLGLIVAQVVPCWRVTPDSAVYIELGRNLAAGRGYVYNEEPFFGYPPVFPGLLAAGIAVFGDSYLVMRAVMAALAIGFLLVSFLLLRRLCGWRVALLLVWLMGLTPPIVLRTQFILSDVPGGLFAVLALLALVRFEQTDYRRGRFGAATLLASGAMLLATGTRLPNLILVPAVALAFFVLRRERFSRATVRTVLPMLLIVVAGAAAWYAARAVSSSAYHRVPFLALLRDQWDWDSGYMSVPGLVVRALKNLRIGFDWIAQMLTGRGWVTTAWLRHLLALLSVLGLVVGFVRRRGPVETFTLCAALLPLVTPFTGQGNRYYIVIAPLLFLYAYEGAAWLAGLVRRLADQDRAVATYAIGALLLLPVVLMAMHVGPLRHVRGLFWSPERAGFAVAFGASMFIGLLGCGPLSLRRLCVPAAATLLLITWVTAQTATTVPTVSTLRKTQSGQAVYCEYPNVLATAEELKRLAAPGDTCVSSVPSLYRGLTGLRAYWFPFRRDLGTVREGLARCDWVVLNLGMPPDERFALPAIEAEPGRFELVVENGPVRLYRVIAPEAEEAP